ncbi:MAG: response regulator [Magnetococcales bacterium]|nr:response regulator [Magnetococcales bacterium]
MTENPSHSTTPRILYMEDDVTMAELVRRRLGRQGFLVDTAPDGLAGLEKLTTACYDVVVLDYKMPNLDGLAVLKRLVGDGKSPPIVMVSGFSSLEIAIEAMRLGAADYVVKETGGNYLELLAGTIRRVLEKQNLILGRAEAEAARQESDLQLRSIADSTGEAIVSANATGHCIFWNRGAETIFGYQEAEMLGQSLALLLPETDRHLYDEALLQLGTIKALQITGRLLELTARDKAGNLFPLELSLSSWTANNKRFFSAVGRDITARKQAEAQRQRFLQTQTLINLLLQSATLDHSLEKQLEITLNLVLDSSWLTTLNRGAIFLFDEEGQVLRLKIQKGLEDSVLHACSTVSFSHCLCGQALAQKKLLFADSSDPRHTIHYEGMPPHSHYCVPIIAKERMLGLLNVYMPAGHQQDAEEEELLNTVANTLSSIIERKQLDERLRHALAMADQANREKSRFLAAMSHEIRTPMNAILGMGEMLAEGELDDEQQHYLQTIHRAGQGLLALINDILDLSKIEAGQLEMESIPFDPREIIQNSVEMFTLKAADQGTLLRTRVAEEVPDRLMGDPQRLQQILLNLLSNAVKFTRDGVVTCSMVQAGAALYRFAVADTGIGIPAERQRTIFQPFVQAETSTSRRFGGTGLGLSICQKLVEKMEGKIWLESQPGCGSRFQVEIRLHPAPVVFEEPEAVTMAPAVSTNAGLSILMADDAAENRLLMEAFLRRSPHQLTMVEDGRQAVDLFKRGRFDLVLMDIQMPGMDGYEATRTIRAWEERHQLPPTPILALTANAMREDVEKTHAVGCTRHLSKPISKKRLLEALSQFVR